MIKRKCIIRLVIATTLFALLLVSSVTAQTNISACTVISSSGNYVLNQSIVNSSNTACIEITSSDVIFDGAGFMVDGCCYTGTYGVSIDSAPAVTNVTIRNLILTDWDYGIYFVDNDNDITNITIENNVVERASTAGVDVEEQWQFAYFYNILIKNNTIRDGGNDGIQVWGQGGYTYNVTIENNTIYNNTNIGVYIKESLNNTLRANNASNNDYGIYLLSSNSSNLSSNTANSNNYKGIYLYSSSNNILSDNSALNNTQWDFYSASNSINNTVINLTIIPTISFTGKDMAIKSASSPAGDPISYQNISKYISATNNSDDSWLFLNISYIDSDVTSMNESTLRMWRYNPTWSQVSDPNGVDTAQNYVYADITSFSIFAPMAELDIIPPIITITSPQNKTYNTTIIALNVSANEIISTWLYSLNGGANVSFMPNTTITASQGANNLTVYANDTAGNCNSSTVDFEVDVPIIINITSPANNSINTTGDINVTVALDRPGNATLNWNGVYESMDGSEKFFYKNKTGLLSGNYSFKVYATDSAGVSNASETRTVTVDRTINYTIDINTSTHTVNKTQSFLAPSKNLTVTIHNNTNASTAGAALTFLRVDSPAQLNSTIVKKLDNYKFAGENFSLEPSGARFIPDIQIQFNYTVEQLANVGISENDLKVKVYNATTEMWEEDLETKIMELNRTHHYLVANLSHICFGAIVALPSTRGKEGYVGAGAGTGGGGVISPEPSSNIEENETVVKNLIAGVPVTFTFSKPEHWIYEIVITGNKSESDIAVRVEALKGISKLVTASAPGTKYINIWIGTERIKEGLIRFKVMNSWIASDGLITENVRMYRWDGSKWNELETKVITKDATYTYYEAKTYAFLPFAISGLKAVATVTPEVTQPAETVTVTPAITEAAPPVGAPPVSLALIIGLLIVIVVVVVMLYLRKK